MDWKVGAQYSKNTKIIKRWGVHDPPSSYGGAAHEYYGSKKKTVYSRLPRTQPQLPALFITSKTHVIITKHASVDQWQCDSVASLLYSPMSSRVGTSLRLLFFIFLNYFFFKLEYTFNQLLPVIFYDAHVKLVKHTGATWVYGHYN